MKPYQRTIQPNALHVNCFLMAIKMFQAGFEFVAVHQGVALLVLQQKIGEYDPVKERYPDICVADPGFKHFLDLPYGYPDNARLDFGEVYCNISQAGQNKDYQEYDQKYFEEFFDNFTTYNSNAKETKKVLNQHIKAL